MATHAPVSELAEPPWLGLAASPWRAARTTWMDVKTHNLRSTAPLEALSWGPAGRAGAASELFPEEGHQHVHTASACTLAGCTPSFCGASRLSPRCWSKHTGQPACSLLCSWGSTPTPCMLCSVNAVQLQACGWRSQSRVELVRLQEQTRSPAVPQRHTRSPPTVLDHAAHTQRGILCAGWRGCQRPCSAQSVRPLVKAGAGSQCRMTWGARGQHGRGAAATQGQGRAAAPPARAGLRGSGVWRRHDVVRATLR